MFYIVYTILHIGVSCVYCQTHRSCNIIIVPQLHNLLISTFPMFAQLFNHLHSLYRQLCDKSYINSIRVWNVRKLTNENMSPPFTILRISKVRAKFQICGLQKSLNSVIIIQIYLFTLVDVSYWLHPYIPRRNKLPLNSRKV